MRECPFAECGAKINDQLFACRRHWGLLSKPNQEKIWAAYRQYVAGLLPLEELRVVQAQVLEETQGVPT